jgi:hypothetical protein
MSIEARTHLRTASWWGLILGTASMCNGAKSFYDYQTTGRVFVEHGYWIVGRDAVWPIVAWFGSGLLLFGYGVYYRSCLRQMRRDEGHLGQQSERWAEYETTAIANCDNRRLPSLIGDQLRNADTPARVERLYGGECPGCSAWIPHHVVRIDKPFLCPSCGWNVCVPTHYMWLRFGLILVPSGLVAYVLGFHGVGLLLATIALFVPVGISVTAAMQRLAPPRFVLSDDYRSQLFSSKSDDASHKP